ncbi:cytochrome b561 [Rhodobacter aestuarii]|uniref:Cytochrome b561 n=1 Tax=Rhodobacter aestuarii TaxID=453582 RepID=A0A1N7NB95_9RHOB|nr:MULTISPECIES: cytochrome b/b6 domain-containing protein [Rhodobacter]PTV96349.1 cytochrome b561 [Rhodobacter aestuarii]SIS95491.1 cytochrome b561 [Rhodobacter aestuarii]SOB92723.1 cytochrome b561 [Rhodobacter sp. JA431]
MSAPQGYSRAQIALHWIVAALIIPQFIFHDFISHAFSASMKGEAVTFNAAVPLHVFTGVLILVMVIWRMVLRFTRGAPAPVPTDNPMMTKIAAAVQHTLYLVLILMVISGGMAWFGGLGFAAGVHGVMKFVLMLLVLIHIAGAVKQQFIEKTGVIGRMMKAAD